MTFAEYLTSERDRVWQRLDAILPPAGEPPERLHEAIRYMVAAGGKRLRPIIANTVCAALGGDPERSMLGAAAIELVHISSLIHDDLPCMDDSDLRRGQPACHKAFDESTAVLTGDWLLVHPFELIGRAAATGELTPQQAAATSAALAEAVCSRGIIAGQIEDLASESRRISLPELERIQELKTASLIEACARIGAIAANADEASSAAVRSYAGALGRCFQIVDDILDVVGDAEALGKPTGADTVNEKVTYVSFFGLEEARCRARAQADEAHAYLSPLPTNEATARLHELVDYVLERES